MQHPVRPLLLLLATAGLGCAPHADTGQLHDEPDDAGTVAYGGGSTAPVVEAPIPACPRRGGMLEVKCDPPPLEDDVALRLRSQAKGCLSIDCPREWMGEPPPAFVELNLGTLELTLLERDGDEWMAVYRDPYGGSSCDLGGNDTNCSFVARIHREDGTVLRELTLSSYFSRPDHLELQDAHFVDGTIYFNEACQSYSKEAGGKCSALVAVDARTGVLLWRSRHLVSNGYFAVLDDAVAVSYGFTNERPRLSLLDKQTGTMTWTKVPPQSIDHMVRRDGRSITAHVHHGESIGFSLRNGELVSP